MVPKDRKISYKNGGFSHLPRSFFLLLGNGFLRGVVFRDASFLKVGLRLALLYQFPSICLSI